MSHLMLNDGPCGVCGTVDDVCYHAPRRRPDVAVIACVRGRTRELAEMVDSLHATAPLFCAGEGEIVLRCDDDDTLMIGFLSALVAAGKVTRFVVGPRLFGYASCGTFINEAYRQTSAELVLVVNDDVIFETPSWDRLLLARAAQHPDGMFVLGVETLNAGNFPFTCVSRRFAEAHGDRVVDDRLVYTDIHLRDAMAEHGRAVRVPEVVLRHEWRGMSADQARAQRVTTTAAYQALYRKCVDETASLVGAMIEGSQLLGESR